MLHIRNDEKLGFMFDLKVGWKTYDFIVKHFVIFILKDDL